MRFTSSALIHNFNCSCLSKFQNTVNDYLQSDLYHQRPATRVRPTQIEILTKHHEHILKIYERIASMGFLSDTTKQHTSKSSDNTDTIKISKTCVKTHLKIVSMKYISYTLCFQYNSFKSSLTQTHTILSDPHGLGRANNNTHGVAFPHRHTDQIIMMVD